MTLGIEIRATVWGHDQTIVSICGIDHSGKNDAAGGDSQHDQSIDFTRSQNHIEIGTGKRVDPVLGYNNVLTLRRERCMDGAGCAFENLAVLG